MATLNDLISQLPNSDEVGLRFVDRFGGESWHGWNSITGRSRQVAGALAHLGVCPGDSVALFFPTSDQFIVAFLGTLLAGGVPVPFCPPTRFGQVGDYVRRCARMLQQCQAKLVLTHESSWNSVAGLSKQCGTRCLKLDELPASDPLIVDVGPDDRAMIQFSSGTTVDPKPAALSHRGLVAQASLLNGYWPFPPGERYTGATWLPLFHDMGLIGCLLPVIESKSTLTLMPPELFAMRPAIWLQTISKYRANVSAAPSFGYRWCLEKTKDEELEGVDLSCWKFALNGAESVSCRVARAFIERFAKFGFPEEAMNPVYGLAEASLAVTFSDTRRHFTSGRFDRDALQISGRATLDEEGVEICAVGTPLPGFEVQIRSTEQQQLPENQVGAIWVKGPSLMLGYLGNHEATSETLVDGWLNTGDLGFLHEGQLYITGRSREILIIRGRNHAPEEVEQVVENVEGTVAGRSAAVSELSPTKDREEVWLFVERRRNIQTDQFHALAEACRDEVLAETGILLDYVVVLSRGAIPKTTSGKTRRKYLLQQHRDRLADPTTNASEITFYVAEGDV